jgi:hypothetical protein
VVDTHFDERSMKLFKRGSAALALAGTLTIAGVVAYAAMRPGAPATITANAAFGAAYKGESSSAYTEVVGTEVKGGPSKGTWTATVQKCSLGVAVVIPKAGNTAPVILSGLAEGAAVNVTLSSAVYALRQIPLVFHVESTLGIDTVTPWITRAVTVTNALYAAERMGAYVTATIGSAFTLGPADTLDCDYLDGVTVPSDGSIHVYVGSLTAQMLMVGFTCTGVSKLAIAAGTQYDVLAHEVGHDLRLDHPTSPMPSGCIATNLMMPSATSRTDITEGQVIRAHTWSDSFLIPSAALPDVTEWLNVYESFWTPTAGAL